MKKVIATFLLFLFFAMFVYSCKSHEKCPAYSKINKIYEFNSKQDNVIHLNG